jgi:nicotinate phosphoribosyltransferase
VTAALLTDKYELTMLSAALRDGTAGRRTTFEVFARRLPDGPPVRGGGGTGRLGSLGEFRLRRRRTGLAVASFLDPATLDYLRGFRFGGDVDGYREGELYFPAPRC